MRKSSIKNIFCLFFFYTFSVTVFLSLLSCSNPSLDDFRHEGEAIAYALTMELRQIRSRDDLLVHAAKLKMLFDSLADLMIEAQKYRMTYPEVEPSLSLFKDNTASERLRIELNRVLHIEGGREVIEKMQEDALTRLSQFPHSPS